MDFDPPGRQREQFDQPHGIIRQPMITGTASSRDRL
jgi:hypothetical protein